MDYKELYNRACRMFAGTGHFSHGPFDETFFTLRVYETSKEIMGRLDESVEEEQVLTAAILHDVGKVELEPSRLFKEYKIRDDAGEEWHRHATLSVPIAEGILKEHNCSPEFIRDVSWLIENHDKRKMQGKTRELDILQDADLLADCGLAGFIRPFLYSGKFRQPVIDAIRFLVKDDRTRNGEMLNLQISKRIAQEKMQLQKSLAKQISKAIDSDLL